MAPAPPGDAPSSQGPAQVAALLERAVAASRRPEPFEPSDAPFWDDPHIAPFLLAAHLDDGTHAASRPSARIDAEVRALADAGLVGPGVRVLDLGCGPGLHAQRLARLGCRVTGLDLSASSLAHARGEAERAGLDVDYRLQDFRTLEDEARYDVVLQAYGELSTFAPDARDDLLARVRRALVPGGVLVCEVSTPRCHPPAGRRWEASPGGFWRPGPHLVLEERFVDPADDGTQVVCDQYVVVDERAVTAYRMWFADHTRASFGAVLARAGFTVERWASSLALEPCSPDDAWLVAVARAC